MPVYKTLLFTRKYLNPQDFKKITFIKKKISFGLNIFLGYMLFLNNLSVYIIIPTL